MKKVIVILIGLLSSVLVTITYAYREPTKQPPVSIYSNGQVVLSDDFIDYLIHVKEFNSTHEIFRTVQYDFPAIKVYMSDFLKEGPKKTAAVREKRCKQYERESKIAEEKRKMEQENRVLGITGEQFILLCDLHNLNSVTSSDYVNFLEKNLVKNKEVYEIKEKTTVFCYKPNLLGVPKPADKAIIETVRKLLKKNGLILNRDFLNGSAAETIQNLLIKRYPCN